MLAPRSAVKEQKAILDHKKGLTDIAVLRENNLLDKIENYVMARRKRKNEQGFFEYEFLGNISTHLIFL